MEILSNENFSEHELKNIIFPSFKNKLNKILLLDKLYKCNNSDTSATVKFLFIQLHNDMNTTSFNTNGIVRCSNILSISRFISDTLDKLTKI